MDVTEFSSASGVPYPINTEAAAMLRKTSFILEMVACLYRVNDIKSMSLVETILKPTVIYWVFDSR